MKINNKVVSQKAVDAIIKDVKAKKELQGLDDSFVQYQVSRYLQYHNKFLEAVISTDFNKLKKSNHYKIFLKNIRHFCRRVYGMFYTPETKNREEYLQDFAEEHTFENLNKLLRTHVSTKERLHLYPDLYKKLFRITRTPKSILDLGCGMNPLSFPYMPLETVNYIACDISRSDLDFIEKFFELCNIPLRTEVIDVFNPNYKKVLESLRKVDVALLFKFVDSIDLRGHKLSEEIIKNVKAKWIILSFSTHSLSKKVMRSPFRGWVERMLERNRMKFFVIREKDEVFYVVKK